MLGRNVYLDNAIKPYFSESQPIFDQLMALRGEQFRQLEGRLTQRVTVGPNTYFIKQHFGVGWKEIFKNLFQGRWPVLGAKNEWLAIRLCEALGVGVPAVLAYGQRGLNPANKQSFILMQELAPVISLEHLCQTWSQTPPSRHLKLKLIEHVARIARTLHQNGVNHRDFYLCHFLLDLSSGLNQLDPDHLKLYLIDLHRAQLRRVTPKRWVIKDLAGLYFSSKEAGLTQRDLYRFIEVYTNTPLREAWASNKNFWQKVKARGERLYRDHTQRK